jgi:hypothetical protein
MPIKIIQNVDNEIFKKGFYSDGTPISVEVYGKKAVILLFVKKVSKTYHRLEVDIDKTGFKISDNGRTELKKLTDSYGLPDIREPERSFVNTYILDIDVQRGDNTFSGELGILHHLFLLLENEENLEKQPLVC